MTLRDSKKLFDEISNLTTEEKNPLTTDIDIKPTAEILRLINNEDKKVAFAVEKELSYIVEAVEIIVTALKNGGRLLYFGAGTSGRLGIIDAAECPPTFGSPKKLIKGYIAGGNEAMFNAKEGAEDSEEKGKSDIIKAKVTNKDVVCGIAASRRTPYVIGAIKKAKKTGAKTLYITSNPRKSFNIKEVDTAICADVGPEVIMGSTRMKSGTAQKMILNMLTTASMVRLGKVYENMMVDLQMTNNKLVERSKRIVMNITGITYEEASKYLKQAKGSVKMAIVMIKANVNYSEAKKRLASTEGFVRKAIEGFKK
jgi:N-acetylmuramic acid 6-phosphate etherase